jgi:hypothetical protein
MPWVEFEPTTPVFERAKTAHALDSSATVIYALLNISEENKANVDAAHIYDRSTDLRNTATIFLRNCVTFHSRSVTEFHIFLPL